jgi:hypothetical protein
MPDWLIGWRAAPPPDCAWLPHDWPVAHFPLGPDTIQLRGWLNHAEFLIRDLTAHAYGPDGPDDRVFGWRAALRAVRQLAGRQNTFTGGHAPLPTDRSAGLAEYLTLRDAILAAQRSTEAPPTMKRLKRSTQKGDGRTKLIGALTKHHQYADGGCLNLVPIGNNELAKAADVSPSTASSFFNKKFQGHMRYKTLCQDSGGLVTALKLLNNEFAPHYLYGSRPSDEGDEDDLK